MTFSSSKILLTLENPAGPGKCRIQEERIDKTATSSCRRSMISALITKYITRNKWKMKKCVAAEKLKCEEDNFFQKLDDNNGS